MVHLSHVKINRKPSHNGYEHGGIEVEAWKELGLPIRVGTGYM